MNGLLEHALWPLIKPYVVIEECEGKTRFRLELKHLPPLLVPIAISMQVACIRCGAVIEPIRTRRPPKNRRSPMVGHGLYIAVACPLGVNVGCSRGNSASAEYQRIKDARYKP